MSLTLFLTLLISTNVIGDLSVFLKSMPESPYREYYESICELKVCEEIHRSYVHGVCQLISSLKFLLLVALKYEDSFFT